MKAIRLWMLSCLLVIAATPLAHAQAFIPLQADGAVSMIPVTGPSGQIFQPGLTQADVQSRGTIAGRGSSSLGNVEIGFDYIRPFWTGRDFTLAVPAANAASFPLLGDIGHVDDHFALAPHVNYRYDVSDILAIKATGSFLNLTGQILRTVTPPDGSTGTLTANSSLTIVTANLPEISTSFLWSELFPRHNRSLFDEVVIDLGLGTRYSSIEQNYTGRLTNTIAGGNANETTHYSHQHFKGVGLSTSLNFSPAVHENWRLYTNLRGSILVGDNVKDSTLALTIAGVGTSTAINQSKTEFIPVGEVEVGAEWLHEFFDFNRPQVPGAVFSVRVGVSAHVWGNVGPLSAGSPQGFQTSNLYLLGAHVMVGLAR